MPNDQDIIRSTGKSDRQVEADLQKAKAEELDVDPLNWWFWIVLAITVAAGYILLKNL